MKQTNAAVLFLSRCDKTLSSGAEVGNLTSATRVARARVMLFATAGKRSHRPNRGRGRGGGGGEEESLNLQPLVTSDGLSFAYAPTHPPLCHALDIKRCEWGRS